jgi:hypothetical protein
VRRRAACYSARRLAQKFKQKRVSFIVSRVGAGSASASAWGSHHRLAFAAAACAACTTVDPGPNFVVPEEQFDQDYFFCHVEPELLFAKKCGSGDPGSGDPANGCHFNSSAVSGMALVNHPTVDCGGGDHPPNRAQVGAASPAQGNFQAASLEMSRDYLTAPIYVRPTGANHPRTIFAKDDPVADVIKTWATK